MDRELQEATKPVRNDKRDSKAVFMSSFVNTYSMVSLFSSKTTLHRVDKTRHGARAGKMTL